LSQSTWPIISSDISRSKTKTNVAKTLVSYSVSKMLVECRQTDSRFDRKMSTDWHQLHFHSVLSIKCVQVIKQQIGSRNRADCYFVHI